VVHGPFPLRSGTMARSVSVHLEAIRQDGGLVQRHAAKHTPSHSILLRARVALQLRLHPLAKPTHTTHPRVCATIDLRALYCVCHKPPRPPKQAIKHHKTASHLLRRNARVYDGPPICRRSDPQHGHDPRPTPTFSTSTNSITA
jgi:hypothetical protein